ncbi:sugar ABC transporter substrate-binding protein [Solilutibacter silvestris]|uniref:ABC-type sugar transport system periplasmic component n=1 Tax=Solilutibacter silvestris TaxID=1645665 RepID=A0A2K1PZJ5_9GAMM|nr:sugar ABC transporter substrate-binding protein [Lysobacter silvestris]PNS08213.1 ABC-type sugar transport system periplasmic component [Lysobacter silvestris]
MKHALRRGVVALLLVTMAACGGQHDSRKVVRFWAMGQEGEAVAKLLPEFERLHPDIRVDLQQVPWTAAHEKLLTAFAGNALPDVVPLGTTWIPEFEALGALAPLDVRIAGSGIDSGDFFAGPWDAGRIDGRTWAIPWYVETRLPFYRRDLLKQAGVTTLPRDWNTWFAAMTAMKARQGSDRYSILLPTNEFEPLLNLAIQQQEPLLRDGGRFGNFRSAGFHRTLAFYKKMFDAGFAPRLDNTRISNVWDEFGNGLFAYYISGPWNISEFRKRLPRSLDGAWGTMPLPGPDCPDHCPGRSIAGGTSFVVFRSSQRQDEAWALVQWLSQPAQLMRLHGLTGDLPSRRSAWAVPSLANDPMMAVFREQMERAVPPPKVPEWERIAQEMRIVGEQVAQGRVDVDAAAADLDRRADAILAKRRWMLDHQRGQATP